jgi:hypothetical protein
LINQGTAHQTVTKNSNIYFLGYAKISRESLGFVQLCDFLTTKLTFLPVTVLKKESEQFYS